jgi:hypothetical protein
MGRVLTAEAAVLVELDPLRRLLLVLRRAVIPALALAARQVNDIAHKYVPKPKPQKSKSHLGIW